jgi:uncharacterized membrane protein (DUF4010 family)
MDIFPYLEPWWRFGAALLIGALIGLEREFIQQRSGDPDFAGIRTFSLITLLGAAAAYLSNQFGILLFVVTYLGMVLLIWASHLGDIYRGESEGITTEVVALIAPLLGGMVIWDLPELAAALGVISALVLALKPTLHGLARRMSPTDLRATLEFALISAVVLPILPNEHYGPFDILNPREIWLLVVLVSAISFFGYVLMKVLGAERGLGIVGLLGGLVSSTAVTLSFSGRSKDTPKLSQMLAMGIVLASGVLFPRVLVEIWAVNADLLPLVAGPIVAMLAVGLIGAALAYRSRRGESSQVDSGVDLRNPLKLTTAVGFGLLFAVLLLIVRGASEIFGDAGVYLASAIAGLADVDAITLSASELAAKGQMQPRVAANAILLAVLMNTGFKAGAAAVIGSPELRRTVLRVMILVWLTGIVTAILGALLQS